MDNGLSAADVMALTKCNSSDPAMVAALTNDRRDDMWDNPFVYLVWLWAFSAFGGGGFGGFGNAANGALTRAEMYDGFTMNNIERQIQGVQNGLCDGFYAMNTTNLQGFNGVSRDLCTGFNSVNNAITESRFAAQNCCCETNRNIDAVRYENAKNTCDIITSGNMNTRDIIEAQNAGFQRVIDFMTNDKIENLRTELQSAQLALQNNAQTQTLINELRPCAKPAYITCSPYTTAYNGFGYNNGCCCGV